MKLYHNFIIENKKSRGYWTKDKLQELANKCNTRKEFSRNNGAYWAANKNKILDQLFKNHPNQGYEKTKPGYWTLDTLQEEVNKYKTRIEFKKNNYAAYSTACKRKLMNLLFKNHQNEGYLDKEEWIDNSYVIYVYELNDYNRAYVGLTNDINRRDKEHLFDEKEALYKFCKKK